VKNSWITVFACVLAAMAATTASAAALDSSAGTAAVAEKGKMLVASNGARLGVVYRVESDGSAQMIIDGKLVTIPAATISSVDGKLTTSLSKSEVLALH
jgi:hypothetical protein